ncbi:hypothetical protein GH714_027886 [Hevea brasiliensis]|uniref:Pentatricopeptide repeat-containing protein n=1 Tax=Hevea brasiliensis TaxID=3981 RepID=A0A6A6MR00_HEVBR|nr:hypothetical protein GH714_027886 [Hevea brasiliensis]
MMVTSSTAATSIPPAKTFLWRRTSMTVNAKGRGDNRKPLQKGRNLSIEAIQAVQALKRSYYNSNQSHSFRHVFRSKFSRLLKLDILSMECYDFMKALGYEPDRPTFRMLINGLESIGESGASTILRQDAQNYYGESLDFLEEDEDEMTTSNSSDGKLN